MAYQAVDGERDGKLDATRLCGMAPTWKDASVWFCGPAGFGHKLRQDLLARGFEAKHFHQELFDMGTQAFLLSRLSAPSPSLFYVPLDIRKPFVLYTHIIVFILHRLKK
jgi:ferredoxin-NADP reductase